jgi:crotonobetainyl-CoA:carnitine CoA-transferase CaiB-like acyl-CoA transferase
MGPLEGFKMLDLSRLLPGPFCSLLLADLEMEVLKIEDPEQGDYMRKMGSPRKGDSADFLALNRNKKSMTLNIKMEEGKKIFYKLIETYDIVLESFRPGVMDRLDISYNKLKKRNPRVILCSLSGYGQKGPYRDRSGHDINYIGLGGVLDLIGAKKGAPVIPGVQIADIGGGGMMAAIAILVAIIQRQKTGEGQYLDVSMLDGIISWLSMYAGRYFMNQELPKRGDMLITGRYACYQVYLTKDKRYMSLGALEQKFWKNFCEAIRRKDFVQKQFVEGDERLLIIKEIQKLFKTKTQKEWIHFFKDVDACCEPILTLEEVFQHPQIVYRKLVTELEHPVEGKIQQIGNPIKSSQFSFKIRTPPPLLGEHTMEILKAIGYTSKEIRQLKQMKIV